MSYLTEKLLPEQAKAMTGDYPYVLAHMMSEVVFGHTDEVMINEKELLEARFFSPESELHIFRRDKEWMAVRITDGDDGDWMTRGYLLEKRYANLGNTLVIKDYLAADEDGQIYVTLSRLCDIVWEGEYGKEL